MARRPLQTDHRALRRQRRRGGRRHQLRPRPRLPTARCRAPRRKPSSLSLLLRRLRRASPRRSSPQTHGDGKRTGTPSSLLLHRRHLPRRLHPRLRRCQRNPPGRRRPRRRLRRAAATRRRRPRAAKAAEIVGRHREAAGALAATALWGPRAVGSAVGATATSRRETKTRKRLATWRWRADATLVEATGRGTADQHEMLRPLRPRQRVQPKVRLSLHLLA
mmetsp:Transcript_69313/g.137436  ORF Transcript_69313/g.137436 Transcript_69313/m.137436 type:complete len:220 (+) Transcript_69313:434-1093(+)